MGSMNGPVPVEPFAQRSNPKNIPCWHQTPPQRAREVYQTVTSKGQNSDKAEARTPPSHSTEQLMLGLTGK